MSSLQSLYESVATSPFLPSRVLPGCFAKSSQMDFPRPSMSVEPSIWKLAVKRRQRAHGAERNAESAKIGVVLPPRPCIRETGGTHRWRTPK